MGIGTEPNKDLTLATRTSTKTSVISPRSPITRDKEKAAREKALREAQSKQPAGKKKRIKL